MGNKHSKNHNLLDLIPIQAKAWGEQSNGAVFLKRPRFKSPWLNKIMVRLGISPYVHIHLDEFGSFVWNHCNGTRPVSEIADKLHKQFGESVNPVYERLGAFIKLLAYEELITYKIDLDEA